MEYTHKTVLLNEAIEQLNIKPDGIYIDMTTGGAGHSSEILKRLSTGHLYCIDQDNYALFNSFPKLTAISETNFTMIKSNFCNVQAILKEKYNVEKVDGILYDLGVSSFQFDIPERGFSYRNNAPLDMRMDLESNLKAVDIVNEYTFEELARIFYKYAEEPFAKQIARAIEKARKVKRIETTFQLVDVIKSALPAKELSKKGHPAKRVFQALRIAVNNELRVFEDSLIDSLNMLDNNGRVVVITFHSLEDKICKYIFNEYSTNKDLERLPVMPVDNTEFRLINKKVILPSEEELKENNRSHSAKMRVIERK